jgi:hypothetical protein
MEPLIRSVRSSKIQDHHLDRLAIVYVRQSSLRQVMEHLESRERQYDLGAHAVALGWPAERVVIIDDDQGRSGRTADRRTGFQRLLAEVALDHVGVILGLEMSRLARSSKDWHHLVERLAPSVGALRIVWRPTWRPGRVVQSNGEQRSVVAWLEGDDE